MKVFETLEIKEMSRNSARTLQEFVRRHKCEQCESVFACESCTKMTIRSLQGLRRKNVKHRNAHGDTLYSMEHYPFNRDMRWLCPNCQENQ